MTCQLARSIARKLAASIVLGTLALASLSSPTSRAQGADAGSPASTAAAQDTSTPTAPAQTTPIEENRAPQSAFDPVAERIKYLHDKLRIMPAQEPLWVNLAQVMQENANSMALLLKERFQTLKSGNAIDSISTYEKLGEVQLEGLKKFIASFQALYNSLSDDQKKIADVVFRLSLLRSVGSPLLPGQLATPAPYAYVPSFPAPPTYPFYTPYSDYSYYNPLLFNSPITLGSSFFFRRRHRDFFSDRRHELFPFRPPVRVGVPPARLGVPNFHPGVPPFRPSFRPGLPAFHPGVPAFRLGAPPGRGR